jgi:RNA polymerase sigma-70 factor (ECF subfamily)
MPRETGDPPPGGRQTRSGVQSDVPGPVLSIRGVVREEVDEQSLIAAAQRGNMDAFNELVLLYQDQVYNLAYRIMGDPASASDAAQEAFISAYQHIDGFRGKYPSSFKSWLMRIVSNACYDELRRRKRRPTTSIEDFETDEEANPALVSEAEGPAEHAEREEMARVIQTGIQTLPADQRVALVLSDVQGFSYQEIAEMTDVPLGTVKSRLARARGKLRDYLRDQGELLPLQYRHN